MWLFKSTVRVISTFCRRSTHRFCRTRQYKQQECGKAALTSQAVTQILKDAITGNDLADPQKSKGTRLESNVQWSE